MCTELNNAENRSAAFLSGYQEGKIYQKHQPKVLLVDDNPIAQKAATFFLKDVGYTNIIVAATGKQALNLFSTQYDLVVLDIDLPDLKGTEVCRQMRKQVSNKKIPIIAYSSHKDKLTKQECLNVGMNDYIHKSASLDEFKSVIQHVLDN